MLVNVSFPFEIVLMYSDRIHLINNKPTRIDGSGQRGQKGKAAVHRHTHSPLLLQPSQTSSHTGTSYIRDVFSSITSKKKKPKKDISLSLFKLKMKCCKNGIYYLAFCQLCTPTVLFWMENLNNLAMLHNRRVWKYPKINSFPIYEW